MVSARWAQSDRPGPEGADSGQLCGDSKTSQKKSRRFRRLLKLITGRRQTEWTGATRCPNEDDLSHKRESLTGRKRAIFFKIYLPCRPLAELAAHLSHPSSRPCAGTHTPRPE